MAAAWWADHRVARAVATPGLTSEAGAVITLLLAMLRARLGIAATTFVLTILAVAVALAGPLYARAAADSALAVEVQAAPTRRTHHHR